MERGGEEKGDGGGGGNILCKGGVEKGKEEKGMWGAYHSTSVLTISEGKGTEGKGRISHSPPSSQAKSSEVK
jgi:hypothetical protein